MKEETDLGITSPRKRVEKPDDVVVGASSEMETALPDPQTSREVPQYHRDFIELEKISTTNTGVIFRVQSKINGDYYG